MIQVTIIIATLWTLARFQFQVSGECSTDPAPSIEEHELPLFSYTIIVDAGSSGSRIHVYNWKKQDSYFALPSFKHIRCHRVTPGVSECKTKEDVEKHLSSLLDAVKPYVPEALHSKSPIYFLATAGMRMMMEDRANSAMEDIAKLLSTTSFNPFLFQSSDDARILSGEEEGIFAWIAANYLTNVFTGGRNGNRQVKTHGILELGGASTQIAFVPKGNILANKYPIRIAGVTYNLYVHSYLIYGQEEVDRWTRMKIFSESPLILQENRSSVNDPCLFRGYSDDYEVNGTLVTFIGQGKPDQCLELLDQMIYKPLEPWRCNPKPCGIGGIYQPTIRSCATFYVMGAFVHPLRRMKVMQTDGSFSLKTLKSEAIEFCSMPFGRLNKNPDAKASYLSKDCLTGLYLPILLEKAYGFRQNTTQLKVPKNTLDDNEIEWSVGAVIYEYERQRCKG